MRPGARSVALALLACGISGCSAIRFGDPATLAGEWTGTLTIEGQSIASSLVIHDGDDLEALLVAPSLRMEAEGEGGLEGGRFTLLLAYELTCPGTMTLVGARQPDSRLTGDLRASDCTGTVLGTFSFRPLAP